MAELGFATFDEMIGQIGSLDRNAAIKHWKANGLDFSKIFYDPDMGAGVPLYNTELQDHKLEGVLDQKLIELCKPAVKDNKRVNLDLEIKNINRSVGAMLSGQIVRLHGHDGLKEDAVNIKFRGTTGQAFGAWLCHGVTMEVAGETNDYVGKGLSGGKIIVYPPTEACQIEPSKAIIAGNTVLYGAITGEVYLRGVAGERFAVRNSGATAVVEGVGDHGCEYMTGGIVVVLGDTGRNFAAGMSGGIAYVLDESKTFYDRCNHSMVELETIEEDFDLVDSQHQDDLHDEKFSFGDMTRYDDLRLRQLIQRHRKHTGSLKAKRILGNWEFYRSKFVKVMPIEYRRALKEIEALRLNENDAA